MTTDDLFDKEDRPYLEGMAVFLRRASLHVISSRACTPGSVKAWRILGEAAEALLETPDFDLTELLYLAAVPSLQGKYR